MVKLKLLPVFKKTGIRAFIVILEISDLKDAFDSSGVASACLVFLTRVQLR